MQTISGIIKSIVPDGGYQSQHGYIYNFQMTIQNASGILTQGQIGSKSQAYPIPIEQPINVEVSNSQEGLKFKKYNPQYAGQGSSQGSPQGSSQPKASGGKGSNRSFAMSYAKDLVVAGKADFSTLTVLAGKIVDWLDDKPPQQPSQQAPQQSPQQTQYQPNPEYSENPDPVPEDDDLRF